MTHLVRFTGCPSRQFVVNATAAVFLVLGFAVHAAEPSTESASLSKWTSQLDAIKTLLEGETSTPTSLAEARDTLEAVRAEARTLIEQQRPALDVVTDEIAALGPVQKEPTEAASIAELRREQTTRLTTLSSEIKEAELLLVRSDRMLNQLAAVRRQDLAQRIMSRGPSPLSPRVWSRAAPELASALDAGRMAFRDFDDSQGSLSRVTGSRITLVAVILGAVVASALMLQWLLRRFGRDPDVTTPSAMQALRATLVVGAARSLLPTAAAVVVYLVVVNERTLTPSVLEVINAALMAAIFFAWTFAFFRASMSPRYPAWRILPVPGNIARGSRFPVLGLALLFAVDIVLTRAVSVYGARLEVTLLKDFIVVAAACGLMLTLMLRQRMWIADAPDAGPPRWRAVRAILSIALVVVPLLGVAGYVPLARYCTTQFLMSSGLILLGLVLHRLGREFIGQAFAAESWPGQRMRLALQADDQAMSRVEFWIGFACDTLLVSACLILGLLIWGADGRDIASWVRQLIFGIKVGNFTFSLADVAASTGVFVLLLVLTRLIQRTLANKILPQTRIAPGLADSIRTSVGYSGLVIAIASALSVLGINLTSLAIVAGALSVGIGFGLQNIFNNFVSGLILLIERPIQAGDWIIIDGVEGHVKKIRVRATEVQTLDRATVFVPNSDLIAHAVTNWTYSSRMGRLIVPIGVAYGSNTKLVRELLLSIAQEHPQVVKSPAPQALFLEFGDSALNFELRCVLRDMESRFQVTSDLCFEIDHRFREAEIEIPFPQRDLHLKTGFSKESTV